MIYRRTLDCSEARCWAVTTNRRVPGLRDPSAREQCPGTGAVIAPLANIHSDLWANC